MKTSPIFILLISLLVCFSCGKKTKDIAVYNEYKPEQVIDFPNSWKAGNTMSIYHYLEDVAYKEKDSIKVIELVKRDAGNGSYFFMIFGLLALPEMDDIYYNKIKADQKKLCAQHNIWIFSMGCDGSETGTIYNREMKRLLKQNKGLDFDSLFDPPLATL